MSWTIGILSVEQYQSFFAERYFREIISAVSATTAASGGIVRMMPPPQPTQTPAQILDYITTQHIDAILVIAPDLAFIDLLSMAMTTLPSIIISAPSLDVQYSYVNSDNHGALCQIVNHLVTLGRRRIRLLLPEEPTGDYLERQRGYEDMLRVHGLAPSIGMFAYPITAAMLDSVVLVDAPDALIVPDDNDAVVLLRLLQRRNLRIPEDIALVGFDDEDFAAETTPALTTISQPLAQMGRLAARYLIDRLLRIERNVYQEILPNLLVVRESCGAKQ